MKLIPLLELTFSDAPQVDHDAGVIRGVRILGRTSRNGREYSDAALKQAARFYDRLGVNLNHPERQKSDGARAVEDGFGWLESIDVRADGVYGDLHYFRAHPSADVIVEAAVRNPRRFGLSHHAEGRVMQHQGKLVVESIESVRSVDVVQNPATNLGLFESEIPTVPRTIREILQETDGPLAQLLEDTSLQAAADHAVDVPDETPHDEQVAIALQSLLVKVLEDEQLDVPTRLHQVFRLMDAHQATTTDDSSDANDPAIVTQLLERIERIEVEAHCRTLLESTNRSCEPARLQALASLATDDERHRLIESWPERDASRVFRPRPVISRPLYETQSESVTWPGDVRSFVAAIR